MRDVSFDLTELAIGAAAVRVAAADAATQSTELAANVEAAAMGWGVDAPGQAFAAGYLRPATEALAAALAVGEQLHAIADNLDQVRATYAADEESGVTLRRGLRT